MKRPIIKISPPTEEDEKAAALMEALHEHDASQSEYGVRVTENGDLAVCSVEEDDE